MLSASFNYINLNKNSIWVSQNYSEKHINLHKHKHAFKCNMVGLVLSSNSYNISKMIYV